MAGRRIPITQVGSIGYVPDILPHELAPEAWSDVSNVRVLEGAVEKMKGEVGIYGTPGVVPYGLFPVAAAANYFWVYASLAKIRAVDNGSTHADLTRAVGGDYSGTIDLGWTGGVLNGVGVFNNGVDVPQAWVAPALATRVIDLANWPANFTARALRPFKTYLVAMDVTNTSVRYPWTMRWSHAADPGAVPTSWDITDTGVDAGETSFGDSPGILMDSLPLSDANIVYKEDQTWSMRFVGGEFVFAFERILEFAGMLSRNCAAPFHDNGPKHAVFGTEDLYVHNGNNGMSIGDKRVKRTLYNQLSTDYYQRSFTVANPVTGEVWFCFVPQGQTLCTKALVWSAKDNRFCGFRDLPGCRAGNVGVSFSTGSGTTWSADSAVWGADGTSWDSGTGRAKRELLLADATNTLLKRVEQTNTFNGTVMTSYAKRTGLAVVGVESQTGKPVIDSEVVKQLLELWPRVDAPSGTVLTIYVGGHDKPEQEVTWSSAFTFTVGVDRCIYPNVSHRYLAVWFQTAADVEWKLHGYDLVLMPRGRLYGA